MAKVLLKKSSVTGNKPGPSNLEYGELAINYADGKLHYKNSSNEIKSFADSDVVSTTYLRLSGGTMTGPIDMGGQGINNIPSPSQDGSAVNKAYVDNAIVVNDADINYPVGDYGLVNEVDALDAFGVLLTTSVYDNMGPSGASQSMDLGHSSSI